MSERPEPPAEPGAEPPPEAAEPPPSQSPVRIRSHYGDGPIPPGAGLGGLPAEVDSASIAPWTGRHVLASWSRRALATLLDLALIGAGAALIVGLFALLFLAGDVAGTISVVVGVLVAMFAFCLAVLLYPPLVMGRWDGQTVGKRVCGIRVIRVNGKPMDTGWSMLREALVKWIGFIIVGGSVTFGVAPLVDMLWPLWDDERRALHDFVAGTRVVRSSGAGDDA